MLRLPVDRRPFPAIVLLFAVLAAGVVDAQEIKPLTVERIYASNEFGGGGANVRWLDDGHSYIALESSADSDRGRDLVRHDLVAGEREVLVEAREFVPDQARRPLRVERFDWSPDMSRWLIYTNSQRVWRQNTRGDYWLLDQQTGTLRQLGGDVPEASLMFATFSPDGDRVAYVHERNLYIEDVATGEITQLTRTETDDIVNGTFDWVYEEEFGIRRGFRWSPDGEKLAYWQIDTTGVGTFPLVNNTDSLYPRITWIKYPKVGQTNPACRVGVVELENGQTTWMDVPGDPRNHYIARMDWADDSNEIALLQLNRLQNTMRVMLADAGSGEARTILTERDDAWVDVHDEMMWLNQGTAFTWMSEREGWRHVYIASRSGDQLRQVTQGDFDVMELLHVDEQNETIYSLASPDNATQRYLFRSRLDGSGRERVTPADQPGTHSYNISPTGEFALHTWSSFETPSVSEIVSLPGHERVRLLEDNERLRSRLEELEAVQSEFFRVEIEEGVELDAWCMQPAEREPGVRYPLLIYVYGEPAGQTVLDRWGGSTYLWHRMLVEQGYVVMSFDNRGTPGPRGRAWRKSIYRQIGGLAPRDQAAALQRVLEERPYLDPERVGIWGWSGGGSMSLNAIFKYPDLYHTAIAIAPVAHQHYYDTIYQERYMGLPADNVEGFRNGSPLEFAENLEGNLLLIHGTGDDNCHYQATEKLINKLIEHNRPFTMMAYPNRTHAIREGRNTTRHLRELMTAYLIENLPPGPR